MKIISDTGTLEQTCREISRQEYVAVDTEFLRETTFWPELCLIQMACPDNEVIIDVLSHNLELESFFELMGNEGIVKVFHSARQDIEIIYKLGKLLPRPIFDTQVAAMVCGFGDSVSYDQLIFRLIGEHIDKSSQFTDWSKRPLSEKQLTYAIGDVTHLREAYPLIKNRLENRNRAHWVKEEMETLTSERTYDSPPEEAWCRLKMRARKPREFAIMQRVAEWREIMARKNNVTRRSILKDDMIYEIICNPPGDENTLSAMRSMRYGFNRARYGKGLLEAVSRAQELSDKQLPGLPKSRQMPEGAGAIAEILKVLLKIIAEEKGVSARIIANVADLERIAADDNADVPALQGWRYELFGKSALKLKRGEIALGILKKKIRTIELADSDQTGLYALNKF